MNTKKFLKQKAIYWAPNAPDEYGNTTYADPVEVKCRWEHISDLINTGDKQEFMASHYVLVDRDLQEGGLLRLGELADWDGTPSVTVDGVETIVKFMKTPDLRARNYVREVWL